jgi:hypothetical protein
VCDLSCMYMVPYICLCKAVCDLSYRCIWYPILANVRQCVTCLIDVYGSIRHVTHCLT